jgi:adenylylsulfate kinase
MSTRQPENIHTYEHASPIAGMRPRAPTIWITGLSGSGKSTTAYEVERRLLEDGIPCYVLDGDSLRCGINRDLGFTLHDRSENIRRTAEIARLFNSAGLVAIVSVISPLAADRTLAQTIIGDEHFVEVFMNTPIDVCEKRDPKGLYRKARLGLIESFTGITSPYQEPQRPDVLVSAEQATPGQNADRIITVAMNKIVRI